VEVGLEPNIMKGSSTIFEGAEIKIKKNKNYSTVCCQNGKGTTIYARLMRERDKTQLHKVFMTISLVLKGHVKV
jgi:hypothetical protein